MGCIKTPYHTSIMLGKMSILHTNDYIMFSLLMLRGGIVLTFSGTNLDVVAQPVFVYTDPRINSTLGVRRNIRVQWNLR